MARTSRRQPNSYRGGRVVGNLAYDERYAVNFPVFGNDFNIRKELPDHGGEYEKDEQRAGFRQPCL